MSTEPDHECTETYRACVESRRARIMEVIADNPDATKKQLAKLAGVSARTIQSYRNEGEKPFSPKETVKLSELYNTATVAYWEQPKVKAVETALNACNREQLAYLFAEVLPIFHLNLVRKSNELDPKNGAAKTD
jgi:hypothetical protein